MASLRREIEEIKGGPHLHTLNTVDDIGELPLLEMKQIHRQLSSDLEKLNQVSSDVNNVYVVKVLHLASMIYGQIHNHHSRQQEKG